MIYAYVATALVAAVLAGASAWRVQTWRYDSKELERVEQARETEVMRRKAANVATAGHEGDKSQIRTQFLTITEKVEHEIQTDRLVYSTVCVGPGGLQQLADAARATGDPAQPGNPVPGASGPR